ncbi:MAG: tRNA pseudouridine(38-40) synthase TruA [Mariprofundales bacterium]
MQRIAMVVEFDGREYCGWQRQKNGLAVQQVLEEALLVLESEQDSIQVHASGRTDSGVHAEAMLVHTDISSARFTRSSLAYVHGLNAQLPIDVRILGVRAVANDFHARFDCLERSYRYRIWNRNTSSSLYPWRHWWMPRELDVAAMQRAAHLLLGEHDFSAFRATGCQASSPIRQLAHAEIKRDGWSVELSFHANGFLYHMVRNLVGTLVEVGLHKRSPESMLSLLQSKDRAQAGATAPACGLYFTDAAYERFTTRQLINRA